MLLQIGRAKHLAIQGELPPPPPPSASLVPGSAAYRAQVDQIISVQANLTDVQKIQARLARARNEPRMQAGSLACTHMRTCGWAAGGVLRREDAVAGGGAAAEQGGARHLQAAQAGGPHPPGPGHRPGHLRRQLGRLGAEGTARQLTAFLGRSQTRPATVSTAEPGMHTDAQVHFDAIRPISAIRYTYGDNPITAWLGPGKGTGTTTGNGYRSYLRTMQHSDYPSGSGCAFYDFLQPLCSITMHLYLSNG